MENLGKQSAARSCHETLNERLKKLRHPGEGVLP
jgi:hypothetical protein